MAIFLYLAGHIVLTCVTELMACAVAYRSYVATMLYSLVIYRSNNLVISLR